ncbi:endolytic transglycosylase MltG [Acidiphilium sp.]|uniref:endolytic transglycosylase MltG n=1 Tax=Acidiphilium sp. TaxID=527 RepID=UPI0025841212|nr:endolytic transglycosylase MltG [Acidiphilium sp.]
MRGSGRLILLLLTVLVLLQLGRMAVNQAYDGPGPLPASADIYIPPGSTRQVAGLLARKKVIRTPLIFEVAAFLTSRQGPIRSGEFRFIDHGSLRSVLRTLRFAPEVEHKATIPEGLTSVQIADIINALPDATGHVAPPPEGSVLPQTYDYTYGTRRAAIIARMQTAMRTALAKAWASRAQGLPLQSPRQALILASIVQLETPLPAELPKIAGVYENRLGKGMMLQADPTVIFAVTHGRSTALTHRVDDHDLSTASPYNTYRHHGLPPGPICAPGLAAIRAVLHPADTDALFFVATGKGGHVFARTFAKQRANIARYLARTSKKASALPTTR